MKRIAFLPHIRRDKVLNIRRQIMDGTYEVADRFGKTIDRVLEALTT
ncbi:MAG: flagellar biosynthesis anti-sigma factor FlgM [Planctomycetes bacterium]|nr:flagellar biosynthesis anti-sigma factor FlgM [Planctomycetota bacterium]